MKFAIASVFLQCLGIILASEVPSTKTYGSYSMTHPATSTGVYPYGSTNTYPQGSTVYYPQGATVTYPQTTTVYYPTACTVGGINYGAGTYYTYPAGATTTYAPGATCYFPQQTRCTYGSYNGAQSCAVRYPAQTYVQCSAPAQPTYYGPGTYTAGATYPNYSQTGGTQVVYSGNTKYSVCTTGYTQAGYPVSTVTNQNTGQTSCVTQMGPNNYITYTNSGGVNNVSSGNNFYG